MRLPNSTCATESPSIGSCEGKQGPYLCPGRAVVLAQRAVHLAPPNVPVAVAAHMAPPCSRHAVTSVAYHTAKQQYLNGMCRDIQTSAKHASMSS